MSSVNKKNWPKSLNNAIEIISIDDNETIEDVLDREIEESDNTQLKRRVVILRKKIKELETPWYVRLFRCPL